jgi:hypothetical protein
MRVTAGQGLYVLYVRRGSMLSVDICPASLYAPQRDDQIIGEWVLPYNEADDVRHDLADLSWNLRFALRDSYA